MIDNFKYIYKLFPKNVWNLTLLQLLYVLRVTFFTTSRKVGDYTVAVNTSSVLVVAVILLSIVIISKEFRYCKNAHRVIGKLFVFYFLCFASLLWAGFHAVIVFKVLENICNLYIMYIIASKIRDVRLLLIYIIVLSTIMSYIDICNSIMRLGFGFHHTNSYSMSSMIAFLLGIQAKKYKVLPPKILNWLLFFNFIAIIGGTSSATYIASIVGLVLVYSSTKRGVNIKKLIVVSLLAICIYYMFSDSIQGFVFQGKTQENIVSGSGRDAIFKAAINSWKAHPLLGSGYIVGERDLGRYGLGINVLSTHNSFLSVLVDTGLVGMAPFLYFLISWLVCLVKKSKDNVFATMLVPVFIALIINCLSYPAIGADWCYVSSIIFLMYIMTNFYIKRC